MRYGLSEDVIEKIRSVFETFPKIQEVIIYGSRAIGSHREGSDIDFTFFGHGITNNDLNQISLKLDELLLPYTFDLSIFSQICNPNLIDHINRVGKVFYSAINAPKSNKKV